MLISANKTCHAQWAPVATDGDIDGDSYVLVGKRNNNPTSTCHTMKYFNNGELPSYMIDGTKPELKEHVLCCKDPQYVSGLQETAVDQSLGLSGSLSQQLDSRPFNLESSIQNELNPRWFGVNDGWSGGSHGDAVAFCQVKSQNICPYVRTMLIIPNLLDFFSFSPLLYLTLMLCCCNLYSGRVLSKR